MPTHGSVRTLGRARRFSDFAVGPGGHGFAMLVGMSLVNVIKRLVDVAECEAEATSEGSMASWCDSIRPAVPEAQGAVQFVVHDFGEVTKHALWVAARPTRLESSCSGGESLDQLRALQVRFEAGAHIADREVDWHTGDLL